MFVVIFVALCIAMVVLEIVAIALTCKGIRVGDPEKECLNARAFCLLAVAAYPLAVLVVMALAAKSSPLCVLLALMFAMFLAASYAHCRIAYPRVA